MKATSENDNHSWDDLASKLDSSFLQSSYWGDFQASLGFKVHKLNGKNWSCLMYERQAKLGTYVFAPYGPTLERAEVLPEALKEIVEFGRQLGVDWIRLEPCLALSNDSIFEIPKDLRFKVIPSHKQVDPGLTSIIDLKPDESEILAKLSQSTRALIRKNLRDPQLEFRTSTAPGDIHEFLKMIRTVSERNKVLFHSDDYFIKEADFLMPKGVMKLEFALLDQSPIACIVMHEYNRVTNYTYAASLPEARQTNASALLLWQAIMNAKKSGIERLDLFGIAPPDADSSHPWHGFTIFKQKFGGQTVKRGQTLDIPLNSKYKFYRSAIKVSQIIH